MILFLVLFVVPFLIAVLIGQGTFFAGIMVIGALIVIPLYFLGATVWFFWQVKHSKTDAPWKK